MTPRPGAPRVVVTGATGALGSEVLAVLAERRFPVGELRATAGERSLGASLEFAGQEIRVDSELPALRPGDVIFLCAPSGPSLEHAAAALRAGAFAIDGSGALAASRGVPLALAEGPPGAEWLDAPALALPPGTALGWLRALVPLHRALRLRRVLATTFESASRGGRAGIESLSAETIALFNQSDAPEPEVFGRPVAFDCVPELGPLSEDGATEHEARLAGAVRRVLGQEVGVAVTAVQVPTFSGDGTSFALETEAAPELEAVAACLRKVPGLELLGAEGPTVRAAAGSERVLVGRLRRDPTHERGLLLWLVADALRLAAETAVQLAEARLGRR